MFRLLFFTIFFLLSFFIYQRGKELFLKKKARLTFGILLFSGLLTFPLVQLLSFNAQDSRYELFLNFSFFFQIFILYFAFFILVLDLFTFLFKFHWKRKIAEHRYASFFHLGILLFLFAILAWGHFHFYDTKIHPYTIDLSSKNIQSPNLRLVFAADFHLKSQYDLNDVKEFVKLTNSLHPDIVFIVGDFLEGARFHSEMPPLENEFRKLVAPLGVFAVLGNHEAYGRNFNLDFFKNANIKLLRDEILDLATPITLIGRDDLHFKERAKLNSLTKNLSPNRMNILLDHRPNEYEQIATTNIDMVFSGHTHHGQIFPFSFVSALVHPLSWGHKIINKVHFFVTSGFRGWGPHLRTSADSEIVLIDVQLSQNDKK